MRTKDRLIRWGLLTLEYFIFTSIVLFVIVSIYYNPIAPPV